MSARVAFLGLSHLGIVSSAAWASLGQSVLAVDPDSDLVARLSHGDLPIHEPGLGQLLERTRATLRYSARLQDLTKCPLVIVSRDVPTDEGGASDPSVVTQLLGAAIPHLAQDAILVVMSQVQPGYTRELGERIARARPQLRFRLHYLVETLVFGDAVRRATDPERIIVGCAEPDQPLPPPLREAFERFGCPILPMSYESAELAKTAVNLYLIGSVTYANTMADICEAIGADWTQVVPALRLDARIGPAAYLRPSLGISGGNLERDLATLRGIGADGHVDDAYLHALAVHNERRFAWLVRTLEGPLAAAGGEATVAIWGLAYKGGTRSLKNAPSLKLIGALRRRASLHAWDPVVTSSDLAEALGPDHSVTRASSAQDAVAGADCLVVITDWEEFRDADLSAVRAQMRHAVIVDCVGVIDPTRAGRAGIDLHSMGRR